MRGFGETAGKAEFILLLLLGILWGIPYALTKIFVGDNSTTDVGRCARIAGGSSPLACGFHVGEPKAQAGGPRVAIWHPQLRNSAIRLLH